MQETTYLSIQSHPEIDISPQTLADKVLESLQQLPISEPIQLIPEEEFNQEYIDAMKLIFAFLAKKFPEEHLNPDIMMAEYTKQYGIITEQDHIDCLKLALKEALTHVAKGKKICILSHDSSRGQKSQQLMSNALYALIVEITGPESARLVMHSKIDLRENIKQMAEQDGANVADYRFVLIDDAAYSGAQLNAILENLLYSLNTLISNPAHNVDVYLAFDKYNMEMPKSRGVNAKTVRTLPPPTPVQQIQFFYDYIFNTSSKSKNHLALSPRAIVTAYNSPDPHSVPEFYKQWSLRSTEGIDNLTVKSKISSLVELLKAEKVLKPTSKIEAFAPKKYPSLAELVQKVRDQINVSGH